MGGAPGEGVTLDGSVGAVGEEFPPQATYPSASRMRNARVRSFFISDSFRLIPARRHPKRASRLPPARARLHLILRNGATSFRAAGCQG